MNTAQYQEIAAGLQIETRAFIDGKHCQSASGKSFESVNPATGEVIASIEHCDSDDVDRAVAAARRSFNEGVWSRADPEERKSVLIKLAELIRANATELSVLESIDSGKTITDCEAEVGGEVPDFFQWYGELIDKQFGKVSTTGSNTVAMIVKEPVGVVGLVVPWNFPLLMAAWKLAPSLAAGCSVVLKPAEQTSLTALRLGELAAKAGLPDGVLNVVPGLGETAGEAIGRHTDIDVVSFTGSTEVGAYFLKYASESNLKPVGLEMGGKSPFIVLDDAAITDDLIDHAVMSAFWNGGQNCSANMRQLVDAKVKDEYLHKVLQRTKALKVGNPLDPNSDMGSMVSQEHQSRVAGFIESGVSEGATQLIGGEKAAGSGFFVNPTVFDSVRPEMTIAREEIFGPVLGVMPIDGMNEALRIAKDTVYGLHATVFTRDVDRAFAMARSLPCGTVSVNGFSEGNITTPFGGYRQSGSLSRDNGVEAMDQYMQTKTIWFELGTAA